MFRNLILVATVFFIYGWTAVDGRVHLRLRSHTLQRRPLLSQTETKLMNARLQHFTFDLYRNINEGAINGENIVFSPISIYSALSVLSRGARDTTLRQIRKALYFPISYHVQSFARKTCRRNDLYTIAMARRVYIDKSSKLQRGFKKFLNVTGLPAAKKLDFQGDPEHARAKMNKWVAHKTMDQIPELLSEQQVTSMTRLYIINALALEAKWLKPFSIGRGRFKVMGRRRPIRAKMLTAASTSCMFTDTAKGRGDTEKWLTDTTMLVLPFQGDKLTYIAVMPNKKGNFAELDTPEGQQKLELMMEKFWNFTSDDGTLNYQDCQVTMPKLTLNYNYNRLKDNLEAMGMTSMFNAQQANFTRLYRSGEQLYVSDVAHKATFELDKYGVKATAATGINIVARMKVPSVSINKPFIFFVRNQETGALLFMGKVVNPSRS